MTTKEIKKSLLEQVVETALSYLEKKRAIGEKVSKKHADDVTNEVIKEFEAQGNEFEYWRERDQARGLVKTEFFAEYYDKFGYAVGKDYAAFIVKPCYVSPTSGHHTKSQNGWRVFGPSGIIHRHYGDKGQWSSTKEKAEAEMRSHWNTLGRPLEELVRFSEDYLSPLKELFADVKQAQKVFDQVSALKKQQAEEKAKRNQAENDRNAKKAKADEMHASLNVFVLNPEIRAFLEKNDPQALKQAIRALEGTPKLDNEEQAKVDAWYEANK